VRTFLPGATAAWVIPGALTPTRNDESALPPEALPMHPLHHAHLFTLLAPAELVGPYHLAVERHGHIALIADPYAFPPLLTDFDMHLGGEGTHRDAYERLGAHPRQVEGVHGVAFTVWAPNARRVSMVGDFNGWDERAHPMRLRPNGVWELFLPAISTG